MHNARTTEVTHRPPHTTAERRAVVSARKAALRTLRRSIRGAVLALAAIALTVGGLTLAERQAASWVLHSREVSRLARTSLILALDQDTGIGGYVLTRNSVSLAPDVAAHPRIAATLDSLVAATADNSEQQARARAIRETHSVWDRTYRMPLLTAVDAGVVDLATAFPASSVLQGKSRFDAFRAEVTAFAEAEEALYTARVDWDRLVAWTALGAVLVELLVLCGVLAHLGRQARAQTTKIFDQHEQLTVQTADLEEQAMLLEEQAAELEAQTDELEGANQALTAMIAERTRAIETIQASEARFRSVVEAASDAIFTSDAAGRILLWNAAAETVYGHTMAEAVGGPLSMLIPDPDRTALAEEYANIVAGRAPHLTTGSVVRTALSKHGHVFPVDVAVSRWESSGAAFVTSVVRDISARVALESQLVYQASHDALTGLANRACFRERTSASLAHQPDRVAVLFLDLDDFKAVNDRAGHVVGDQLLTAVAERLLDATRGSDVVARLGGDEFGVLLPHIGGDVDADAVARRIQSAMRRPFAVGEYTLTVGLSIGIARGAPELDTDTLLRNADTALYAAKGEGGGDFQWFVPAMHAALLERAQIQADLGTALERGELWLAYQPIVSLETGYVEGVEALVRWTHPRRGILSPATFIPIAEATGQIVPLGCWVLEEACRAVVALPGTPYVTVNLSGRQLGDPALVDSVAGALCASGLEPERLVLEITETALMADTTGTLDRLHDLKALGVRLAIDDFGTGYSSLRYLQRFPVDVLKIDKSFVDRVDSDAHDAALVRTIVALGEMLGLTTVAEGIERAAQRDHLKALGCELGQGYHFARPLALAAVAEFLSSAGRAPQPEETTLPTARAPDVVRVPPRQCA